MTSPRSCHVFDSCQINLDLLESHLPCFRNEINKHIGNKGGCSSAKLDAVRHPLRRGYHPQRSQLEAVSWTLLPVEAMNGMSKALINLLRGWPNPQLLPAAAINTASNTVLSDPDISTPALLYAPDPGYEPLRDRIAEWLTAFYSPKQPIHAERICVTGGASQNLACILQVFSDPVYTRNVWMVAPTYFLACRIFVDSGFQGRLRAVPEDQEGIDLEFLSREIQRSEDAARAEGNLKPVGAAETVAATLTHERLEVTLSG